jgi:dimethylhistidine N-methyltransferase
MNLNLSGAKLRATEDYDALRDRFLEVRARTERLAAPLSAEDQCLQSMADASPTKWHRAHTTWFFEEFVLKGVDGYRPFHPRFGFLFNSYYEAVGARHPRPQRGLLSRPDAAQIATYRAYVDDAMELRLRAGAFDAERLLRIDLGLNHEEQHQELILCDILHAFAQNPLNPAYNPAPKAVPRARVDALNFRTFAGGRVGVGHLGEGFAFDNEGPFHEVQLGAFAIAERLVTNREWLAFMAAGGYREPLLWLADGWAMAVANAWQAPLYWRRHDDAWYELTLNGLVALDLDAPVCHVSFYEAEAYARWCGKRLPREAEWELVARSLSPDSGNFLEQEYFCPVPAQGPQFYGDCWEWTQSPYVPYPGFVPGAGAIGEYNGKFMINQMVLRGGSCATPKDHIRASYRNFFYPHQRWQFMGVRLAADCPSPRISSGSGFRRDVIEGLAQAQKTLPSKYFYDAVGSQLFERICELDEYYLTRAEVRLLGQLVGELAPDLAPATALVEFGSGSSTKTRLLLDGIPAITAYVPIEINRALLLACARDLGAAYPQLAIYPVPADFTQAFQVPEAVRGSPLLGFFPGSTIGNLHTADAVRFLAEARTRLGAKGQLLIGIDLVKDPGLLRAAYDDAQGITAAFNKNLLVRINRELVADFELEAFAHEARWNAERARIEMHLVSRRAQIVTVGGRHFSFAAGETIHTENSHKYTLAGFAELGRRAGWKMKTYWLDDAGYAVLLLA